PITSNRTDAERSNVMSLEARSNVMSMARRPFVLTALILVVLLGVARSTPAAVAQPGAPALTWTACDDIPDAECAFIKVPVDYARSDGATIPLRIARLPALDPAQKRGVLLFIPGGPGVGVSDMFGEIDRRAHHVEEFRRRYDVVTFDPRGLGQSS